MNCCCNRVIRNDLDRKLAEDIGGALLRNAALLRQAGGCRADHVGQAVAGAHVAFAGLTGAIAAYQGRFDLELLDDALAALRLHACAAHGFDATIPYNPSASMKVPL